MRAAKWPLEHAVWRKLRSPPLRYKKSSEISDISKRWVELVCNRKYLLDFIRGTRTSMKLPNRQGMGIQPKCFA